MLTIEGYIAQLGDCSCSPPFFWLSPARSFFVLNFEIYQLRANSANPAPWNRRVGHRLRITGRVDDPTARYCTRKDVPASADPKATCASRFVASRIEDLGGR